MEIEELKQELRDCLDEKRYNHSVGVMEMAEKLAMRYGEDVERIRKAALVHDMAKNMPSEDKLKYIEKNSIKISNIERQVPVLLHGKIAADICKKKYCFDEEMCNSIAYHTTGREGMSLFEKIVFIADKIDKTRHYRGLHNLRKLAFENIDEAIIYNINFTMEKNIKYGKLILEDSIKTRNFILINLKK